MIIDGIESRERGHGATEKSNGPSAVVAIKGVPGRVLVQNIQTLGITYPDETKTV